MIFWSIGASHNRFLQKIHTQVYNHNKGIMWYLYQVCLHHRLYLFPETSPVHPDPEQKTRFFFQNTRKQQSVYLPCTCQGGTVQQVFCRPFLCQPVIEKLVCHALPIALTYWVNISVHAKYCYGWQTHSEKKCANKNNNHISVYVAMRLRGLQLLWNSKQGSHITLEYTQS